MLSDLDLGAAAVPSSTPTRRRLAIESTLVAVGVLGSGAVAAVAATPSPSPSASPQRTAEQAERTAERKAERKAEQARRKADRRSGGAAKPARGPVTGPAFVCDPALSHGQNVSAYARSLPKGPGRGRLVSQAARSDCGRTAADD